MIHFIHGGRYYREEQTNTMKNMLRTDRTYATYKGAVRALVKVVERLHRQPDSVRYVIASTPEGRFAPIVCGAHNVDGEPNVLFAHCGITVVG
jgi:hypothetical protein